MLNNCPAAPISKKGSSRCGSHCLTRAPARYRTPLTIIHHGLTIMNKEQFRLAAGLSPQLADRWFGPVLAAMKEFGIDTPLQQACFLGQTGHESQGFTRVSEGLNYSVDGLLLTFRSRMTQAQCEKLGRREGEKTVPPERQKAIANIVYGGKNGNTGADDGWRYRGRGLIQLTGRNNYAACGQGLGLDLLVNPDLLLTDINAARSAAWFWKAKDCNKSAENGDIPGLTKKINGGDNGSADRAKRIKTAADILCRK